MAFLTGGPLGWGGGRALWGRAGGAAAELLEDSFLDSFFSDLSFFSFFSFFSSPSFFSFFSFLGFSSPSSFTFLSAQG